VGQSSDGAMQAIEVTLPDTLWSASKAAD